MRPEKTLQIRESAYPPPRPTRTIPDVMVYGESSVGRSAAVAAPVPGIKTLPLIETFSEEDLLTGLVIYQEIEAPGGKAVTRIELLSPGSKPPGAHHEQYRLKRRLSLQSGLRMVEIDYLHQSRPWIDGLPSYVDAEPGAYPYWVVVNDPRPSFQDGVAHIYEIAVDAPLPTVVVPLVGADSAMLDLNAVYQRTYDRNRFYSMMVDYGQLPARFTAYTPADQQRIRSLLDTIRTGIAAGSRGE